MSNENLISESKEVAKYIPESAAARIYRLIDALTEVERKLKSVVAENAAKDNFVSEMLSIAWQGGSVDGAEIQELALKHSLIRQEVYSADEHETLVDDPGNFEDGDPVYFRIETPATSAFLAEVRASGVDELNDTLCKLLPGCQYMDPPDGGSVTPLEQVSRMVADYREQIQAAEKRIVDLEKRVVSVPNVSSERFWSAFNGRLVFREESYRSAVFKALDAAGISVKGE